MLNPTPAPSVVVTVLPDGGDGPDPAAAPAQHAAAPPTLQSPPQAPQQQQKQTTWQWFKSKVKALKREVLTVYYAMQDPRTPWYAKILPFLVLAFALSPLDIIPDFIPILGVIDDLILIPLLILLAIKFIPSAALADARVRADNEPMRLGRNWCMAFFIFFLWLAGLEAGLYYLLDLYGNDTCRQYIGEILGAVAAASVLAFGVWLGGKVRKERIKAAKVAKKSGLRRPLLAAEGGRVGDEEVADAAGAASSSGPADEEQLRQQEQEQEQEPQAGGAHAV